MSKQQEKNEFFEMFIVYTSFVHAVSEYWSIKGTLSRYIIISYTVFYYFFKNYYYT